MARAMFAPVIARPASCSQKSVWRYSSSAGVATVAMGPILRCPAPGRAGLELALEGLQTLLGEGDERARRGREPAAAARDDREGVVERLGERHPAEALRQTLAECEQEAAPDDGVAEPAAGQHERGLRVLDVDLRLDAHAGALGELG